MITENEIMKEKWVTVEIGGYPRRCPESRLEWVYEQAERLKKEFIQKGAPKEMVERLYTIKIVKDED